MDFDPSDPITASENFQRGLELFEEARFVDALRYIDNALAQNYFGADICNIKAELLFELGQHDEALVWFGKALELDPLNVDLLVRQGLALHALGRMRRAIALFNRAIQQDPLNAEARFRKGVVLLELASTAEARAIFEEARGLSEHNPERQADLDYWLARVDRQEDQQDKARTRLEAVIAAQPSHIPAYTELADVYRWLGDRDKALATYLEGLDQAPDDPSLNNDAGNLLRELGRPQDAIKHLDTAIAANPRHEVAYFNRGLTHEELGNHVEALADFERTSQQDPDDVEVLVKKVDALRALKRFEEAWVQVESLEKAHAGDPEWTLLAAEVLAYWLCHLEKEQRFAETVPLYRRFVVVAPDLLTFPQFEGFPDLESRHNAVRSGLSHLRQSRRDDPDVAIFLAFYCILTDQTKRATTLLANVQEWLDTTEHPLAGAIHGDLPPDLPSRDLWINSLPADPERQAAEATLPDPVLGAFRLQLLSRLALYDADYDRALQLLDHAQALRPNQLDILFEKAQLLEGPADRASEALAVYRELLTLVPDAVGALAGLTRVYDRLGEPVRGLYAVRNYLAHLRDQFGSGRPIPAAEDAAEWQAVLGRLLTLSVNAHEGLAQLAPVQESLDYLPEVRFDYAVALLHLHRYDEARTVLSDLRTREEVPTHIRFYAGILVANSHLRQHRPDAAAQAIAELPAGEWPWERAFLDAAVALESRDWPAAAQHLLALQDLPAPQGPPPRAEIDVWLMQGRLAFHQGDLDVAGDVAAKILDEEPGYINASALAWWCARLTGAEETEATALQGAAQRQAFMRVVGLVHLGQHDAAQAASDAAVQSFGEWAGTWVARAAVQIVGGDAEAAGESLARAKALEPEIVTNPRVASSLGPIWDTPPFAAARGETVADAAGAPSPLERLSPSAYRRDASDTEFFEEDRTGKVDWDDAFTTWLDSEASPES